MRNSKQPNLEHLRLSETVTSQEFRERHFPYGLEEMGQKLNLKQWVEFGKNDKVKRVKFLLSHKKEQNYAICRDMGRP